MNNARFMVLCAAATLLLLLTGGGSSHGYISPPALPNRRRRTCSLLRTEPEKQIGSGNGGLFDGIKSMLAELDAFMDDASARRLGNGAAFYGKRKSNFYGNKDRNKKQDRAMPDPMEDYQAPSSGGYFEWMEDEEGQMRPVTRMKKTVVERNPNYWDRVYSDDDKDDA